LRENIALPAVARAAVAALRPDADEENPSGPERSTRFMSPGTSVASLHQQTAPREPFISNDQKGEAMNRDIIGGKWQQIRGKVKEEWGKLTDDDLKMVEGKFDKLAGLIRERYGYTKEKSEQELDRFCTRNNLYDETDTKR
jgi:uncharacterized protein YjbJ (UPF0337 family)